MDNLNKVAVFGMGKSGKAALKLGQMKGLKVVAVNKGHPDTWYEKEGLQEILTKDLCFAEEEAKEIFGEVSEIIISPGIPTSHPSLELAHERHVPIISEIEFAYRYCKETPVIAITGTNGKTTTTTMIQEALEKAGKKVFCGGNIGIPYCEMALSEKNYDYAVIEVSSFQLETIKDFHPHIGLILNVFPNHSERYDNVKDYGLAKFRIAMNMNENDFMILGTENPYLDDLKTSSPKTFFTKGSLPEEFKKFFFEKAKVKGEHNEANFYAAYKVLELLNIPDLGNLFQDFIQEFKGVAHRLEFVLSKDGLNVYNDAKSTNSLATTTAIKAFKDSEEPFYLILGGKLRSESDKLLPDLLPFKDSIEKVFLIGEVTERLAEELGEEFDCMKAENLKCVFMMCKELKLVGNLVFSPAFPSFDQFKNYVDRGEKFKQWAKESFNGDS